MGAAVSKGHSKDRLVDALASHAAQRSAIYARGTTTPDAAVRAAAMRRAGPLVRLVPDALSGARRGKFLYFLHHEGDLGTFFKPARIGLRYALDEDGDLDGAAGELALMAFPGGREALLAYEEARKSRLVLEALTGRGVTDRGRSAGATPEEAEAQAAADALDTEEALAAAREAIRAFRACPGADVPPRQPTQWAGAEEAQPLFLARFQVGWQRARAAWLAVSLLEKAREYDDAVSALRALLRCGWCLHKRGDMWDRLCIDLGTHLRRKGDELAAALAAIDDPWVRGGGHAAALRRAKKLSQSSAQADARLTASLGLLLAGCEPRVTTVYARQRPQTEENPMARARFFSATSGDVISVEAVVLEHYEADGWRGVHDEGSTLRTLFGLLLWDALFDTSVRYAFASRFQAAPLDLAAESFAPARKERIDAVLREVRRGRAPELVRGAFSAHREKLCVGVRWELWGVDELAEIAACLGGDALADLLQLLADDYGAWSAGLPDLLLWRAPEKGARQARLCEVKSPNDSLSAQQRAWCAALRSAGCDVEMAQVLPPPKRPAAGGFSAWKPNNRRSNKRR